MKSAPESAPAPLWSRRRVLRTVFCSSAMLGLNVNRPAASAAEAAGDQHWLMLGDFGSQEPAQSAVASGLKDYAKSLGAKPQGLLLLGDNFYRKTEKWSVKSERWQKGFEDMYPKDVFDCPCPAVLGNHDYHDNVGGEKVQLGYTKPGSTRWHMPAKWYRLGTPLITFLCLDTNLRSVSGGVNKKDGKPRNSLTEAEEKAQLEWFKAELKKPRTTPWLIVMGHHPVYSNGIHGDTKELVDVYAPLMQEHGVHLYLCGHDHDMQHLELEGQKTSFILSGGGGARVRELENKTRKMPYGLHIYGFSHLAANKDRLLVKHFDANRNPVHAFEKKADFSFKVIS
jgi:tartrate-resistant acid phosphatase type 5